MKIEDLFNVLKSKKIIIYGAGKIGRLVYQSLLGFGLNVEEFWDEFVYGLNIDNTPINKPNHLENPNDYIVIITIFAEYISEEISKGLRKKGYNTIHDRNIINLLIYDSCCEFRKFDLETCHRCPVLRSVGGCDIFNKHNKHISDNSFIIYNIGILITSKCNLSCAGCNHLRYLYDSKDNLDLTPKELLEDLEKIVDASDLIYRLVIVGGEPFIHPKFETILKKILKLPKIAIINIITNGTIVPDNKIIKLLTNERIIVEVSDYGDSISEKLRDNLKKFIFKLEKYNVKYTCMNTLQWYDFGDFERRHYTKEEHLDVYKKCCFVSNDLFRGKLYKCSRSAFGKLLKKIPSFVRDYVDIRNCPKDKLRDKLRKFFKNKLPESCQYCNGTTVKMLKTGDQN